MSTGTLTLIIVVVLIALPIMWATGVYNKLVRLKNRYKNAFAQIEVQLKRRHDLIPNLMETAKGYMKHERETLEAVIAARNSAANALAAAAADPGNAEAMSKLASSEAALMGAMSRFNMVMEAYPDLKANQNMMQFSEELTTTENKVAFARQAYNDAVMEYNTARETFPANIVANLFGHAQPASMLEWSEEEKQAMKEAPKVSF